MSVQDEKRLGKILDMYVYIGFCVHDGSRLLWPPVIGDGIVHGVSEVYILLLIQRSLLTY